MKKINWPFIALLLIIGATHYVVYMIGLHNGNPYDGKVMIDGKNWHIERDSLLAIQGILADKIHQDSIRHAKADSVAGAIATIRLDRIRRIDISKFADTDLDSTVKILYP